MKVRELMSRSVIRIQADEPVTVAARAMSHYNIGAMPVCGADGRLCGMVTDRDIVTRCLAAQREAASTRVGDVMTRQVLTVTPDTEVSAAAKLMGSKQVRRLPVLENHKLCGMLALADIFSAHGQDAEATAALGGISSNISSL